MRPAEWIQAQPLVAAAIAGLLAGIIFGLAWPVEVPEPAKSRAVDWTLPRGLKAARPTESEFIAVRDASIWGDAASGTSGIKRALWSLTGIIADPLPAALVLTEGSNDVKRVRAGEALPDGGIVKWIRSSSIGFVLEGCTYERGLYGGVDKAGNESCNGYPKAVK